MAIASAKITAARISLKHSLAICNAIRRKKLSSAKRLIEDLIDKKKSLDGKYYTKASKKFLEMLNSVEANAKQKNLNLEKLYIKKITANKGYRLIRPRSRFKFRGKQAKVTNLEIVVEER
jgi:ribosomal protein L22